jgi:uncharacterized protein (TIGR02271 family)
MNSSNVKTKIQAVVVIAAAAVLAAGCCTKGQTAYNKTPAPIVEGGGAPPTEVQTETGAATSAQGNMVIPLQKEQMQVGTQQVPDGSVRIRKYVKTETISQPVQVRTESVSIERVPAGAAPPAGSQQGAATDLNKPFQGGEVVINLNKEQPVVSTQVVPNGSVVVNKQESSQTVNVQGQVRSEDVAAVPSGSSQNVHISGNLAPAPGESSGAPPSPTGQSSGAGAGQQITQLDQLTSASDPSAMNGEPVQLSSVPVQKVVGTHLIILGSAGGTPIYVHLAQPASGISAGQMVSVNGTVQQSPSSQGWDPQSTQAIQGQKIFIDATSVTPANQ